MNEIAQSGSTRPGAGPSRSDKKRKAILDAATDVFLKNGYLGASMDEIAALSGISKQTIYQHFGSKENLFVEIVMSMTGAAGDRILGAFAGPRDGDNVADYLEAYAIEQLTVVLTPRLMQLRRLVIGEVSRFPDLAKVLYELGPQRAIATLAIAFQDLANRGLLTIDDFATAATQFNWLVMAAPVNKAMLLGDAAIPGPDEMRKHAADAVRMFLAAYGR